MKRAIIISVAAFLLFGGCWYSFTLKPYGDIETIFVEAFGNETDRYELPLTITEKLIEELYGGSVLKLVGSDAAQSIIGGTITAYENEAYSYTSGEEPLDFRVTVRAKVRFAKAGEDKAIWETSFEGFATYPVDESTKSREQALEEATSMLISRIVDRIRTG
jgi:hypothetical protein